jgi:hypothetical protein
MPLRCGPPSRLLSAAIPSSKDGCLLQLGITIGQVGLFSMSAHAWACHFFMMSVSACWLV